VAVLEWSKGGSCLSPLLLQLLRRVAVLALVAAALFMLGPRVLTELGVLGPSPQEDVEAAARAVAAARAYGAAEDQPDLAAGLRDLERARQLVAAGQGRDARRLAAQVRAHAVNAQRAALAAREDARRQAKQVVDRIDDQMNRLEDLYAQVAAGRGTHDTSHLMSLMKSARQSGASLFLAYEQGEYLRVIEGEGPALEALAGAEERLRASGVIEQGGAVSRPPETPSRSPK